MARARIAHFATHGLLEGLHPNEVPGAIALAASAGDNGLLTAGEIAGLRLNSEMVVLSACDTGRGVVTGDGVIGLSRSLVTAGVPTAIVSLWKVPDDSTAFLMNKFYQNLQTTAVSDKALALRQAMLATRERFPHPFHWASFVLIGEAD
jgi:CHAT domain-containing protein